MKDEYYLQDSDTYFGNSMVFWAVNCAGYTSDISRAHVFTKKEAYAQHDTRDSDIPWPKEYIDSKTSMTVDSQSVRRSEALKL